MPRTSFYTLILSLLTLLVSGCTSSQNPSGSFDTIPETPVARPLILVPGVTGTELKTLDDGTTVWGDGKRLLVPRDGAYNMARVISEPDAASRLEAGEVIDEITLLGLTLTEVYGPILDTLEGIGYRRGNLENPDSTATLYPFAYDWRQDNIESAEFLLQQLQALRRERGEERLKVDLICQSNGSHICRYLAKYGGVSLEDAEAGRGGLPPEIEVGKIILVGSANGGSLRILRDLHRGRIYVPLIGRPMHPEVPFTYPSLFQDLAHRGPRYFVDEQGRSLDLDLWDPANWEKYGWSIFHPEARQRVLGHEDLFGDLQAWRDHLVSSLQLGERFQNLLARDADGFRVDEYDFIQNVFEPTTRRVVLTEEGELLFIDDAALEDRPTLRAMVHAPGDGHASLASQMHLSAQERSVLKSVVHVSGSHFRMIHAEKTRQALARFLRGE